MDTIDQIRKFNRFFSREMALFSRNYVQSGLSLTEIRIFREIAEGAGNTAREIADHLEVDEGYLSRVVRNFVDKGWLEQIRSPDDARRKILSLTAAGTKLFHVLRDRTREDIATRLKGRDTKMIVRAMEHVQTYMSVTDPEKISIRDMIPGDIGWLIQRHGELYISEFGFNDDFERLCADILFEFRDNYDPSTHRAFIACHGNVPLGSVFYEPGSAEGWAKLRVFFVEPAARGLGIGQTLVDACLEGAREAGYSEMELYTFKDLLAARRLYARNGFECQKRKPMYFGGRENVEEYWTRTL